MSTSDKPSIGGLEKSLEELEALVTRLESGDLPLEQAEQKVEILLKKTEQAEPVPFEPAEDYET